MTAATKLPPAARRGVSNSSDASLPMRRAPAHPDPTGAWGAQTNKAPWPDPENVPHGMQESCRRADVVVLAVLDVVASRLVSSLAKRLRYWSLPGKDFDAVQVTHGVCFQCRAEGAGLPRLGA